MAAVLRLRLRLRGRVRVRLRGRRGRGRDAGVRHLGEEVQALRVVVGVRHGRADDVAADDVAEGLRRVALLARRGGLLAAVPLHADAGRDQREAQQPAHDAAHDGRRVEGFAGRRGRWWLGRCARVGC